MSQQTIEALNVLIAAMDKAIDQTVQNSGRKTINPDTWHLHNQQAGFIAGVEQCRTNARNMIKNLQTSDDEPNVRQIGGSDV